MFKVLKNKKILILIFIIIIIITLDIVLKNSTNEINNCKKEEILSLEREHKLCQSINLKNLNLNEKKIRIGEVIKKGINNSFDVSNYMIDVSESSSDEEITKIYDLTFYIGGARTNIGYTVFVNEDDTLIESVFDNMYGYKASELKEKYEDNIKSKINNLSQSRIESMRNKVLDIPTDSNYTITITITSEGKRFDIASNKLYYTISYEGMDIIEESDFNPPTWANTYEEEI